MHAVELLDLKRKCEGRQGESWEAEAVSKFQAEGTLRAFMHPIGFRNTALMFLYCVLLQSDFHVTVVDGDAHKPPFDVQRTHVPTFEVSTKFIVATYDISLTAFPLDRCAFATKSRVRGTYIFRPRLLG